MYLAVESIEHLTPRGADRGCALGVSGAIIQKGYGQRMFRVRAAPAAHANVSQHDSFRHFQ